MELKTFAQLVAEGLLWEWKPDDKALDERFNTNTKGVLTQLASLLQMVDTAMKSNKEFVEGKVDANTQKLAEVLDAMSTDQERMDMLTQILTTVEAGDADVMSVLNNAISSKVSKDELGTFAEFEAKYNEVAQ